MRLNLLCALGLMLCIMPTATAANIDGSALNLLYLIPFMGLLLSIAILPIIFPTIWHRHFGKITLFWTSALLIPFSLAFGISASGAVVIHAFITEYLPFIIILFTLYTLSGGIWISADLKGTPATNVGILTLGTLCASIMGTTGAAMLFIRPLLKANHHRQYKTHIVIFFIFLVANVGGGLTPLGDPPLFLGFLKGISFKWTFEHMLLPVLFVSGCLLLFFYLIDYFYFQKELKQTPQRKYSAPFHIYGKRNLILLSLVIGIVLLSGAWRSGYNLTVFNLSLPIENIIRDALLLIIAGLSLSFTANQIRAGNDFNWSPVLEVAKLFAGIFITIIPAIAILQAGQAGKLSFVGEWVSNTNGEPIDKMYFWVTGILSSFLDNAPTYLVFFNLAGGDPNHLMNAMASTLLAISMGAVFMGAMSYIGNAPNFMVKAIAEQYHIQMPSFFGYMKWSCGILLPIFVGCSWIFL